MKYASSLLAALFPLLLTLVPAHACDCTSGGHWVNYWSGHGPFFWVGEYAQVYFRFDSTLNGQKCMPDLNYTITWGDGASNTGTVSFSSSCQDHGTSYYCSTGLVHTYKEPGTYSYNMLWNGCSYTGTIRVVNPDFFEIEGKNFFYANTQEAANLLTLWVNISLTGKASPDICSSYELKIVGSGGRGATQSSCSTSPSRESVPQYFYPYKFELAVNPEANQRMANFDNGSIQMCEKANPSKCYPLVGSPTNISFSGLTFNLRRHAWRFANGSWVRGIPYDSWTRKNMFFRYADVISRYINLPRRWGFWRTLGWSGSILGTWQPKGQCYGLASAAIANYTHEGEDYWGQGGSVNEWRGAIESHWPDTAGKATSPFKPFLTGDLYSASETYDAVTSWTTQSARKIMYYFVAQSASPGSNWVGKDIDTIPMDPSGSQVRDILRKGSPVAFGFWFPRGGHAVAITQMVSDSNGVSYLIWDNNYPSGSLLPDGYCPFLVLVSNSGNPSAIGNSIDLVNVETGKRRTEYGSIYRPEILQVETTSGGTLKIADSQNIYNQWSTASASPPSSSPMPKVQKSPSLEYEQPNHLTVILVGAALNGVYNKADGTAIPLLPDGEILAGQAVVQRRMGDLLTYLHLPVDKTYRIEATKFTQIEGLTVMVTIPNADGTVERINCEDLQTGATDATSILFYVGRGNSDRAIQRNNGESLSSVEPSYVATAATDPDAPWFFNGYYDNLECTSCVRLAWIKGAHPGITGTRIVRKESGAPGSPEDGVLIYEGTAQNADDTTAEANKKYYYAAFSTGSTYSSGAYTTVDTSLYSIFGLATLAGSASGIQDAMVTLKQLNSVTWAYDTIRSAVTDALGRYSFGNVEPASYQVLVAKAGYDSAPFDATPQVVNKSARADFSLSAKAALLLLFDQDKVVENHTVVIPWSYRNIGGTALLTVAIDRGSGWETIAAGVAANAGQVQWPVTLTAASPQSATVRVSLDSNPSAYAEHSFVIQRTPSVLTVTRSGEETGSISPDKGTLTWTGNTGAETYEDNTTVKLKVVPAWGSAFDGWSGEGCSGTGDCTVTMSTNKAIVADFRTVPLINIYLLLIRR